MTNNMTVVNHPLYFSLFHRLKVKLEGHHFETIEVMETVLNTFTEHDLQDAFNKWQKHWERFIHGEEDYFMGDGSQ
jgi:hypothetical protein